MNEEHDVRVPVAVAIGAFTGGVLLPAVLPSHNLSLWQRFLLAVAGGTVCGLVADTSLSTPVDHGYTPAAPSEDLGELWADALEDAKEHIIAFRTSQLTNGQEGTKGTDGGSGE